METFASQCPVTDTDSIAIRPDITDEYHSDDDDNSSRRYGVILSIGTNLLSDILAVPELNLEVALGNRWSLKANGMYAWWARRDRGRYWRLQGGAISIRKYFGHEKRIAFSGHHAGLFGGIVRYDFCLGRKGVLSGGSDVPFTTRPSWCTGIEYGYSIALLPRLRLDLSAGIGYLWGTYMRYRNENGHSIWESTHRRRWFGPVKAEVTLSWIIGKGGSL
ncbi:MAG: DUF3575 domain-containing protein [Muribaculaceae bacterium]|nr:DUF3575 domain-containing protein [Muribaculaceae bacterium]